MISTLGSSHLPYPSVGCGVPSTTVVAADDGDTGGFGKVDIIAPSHSLLRKLKIENYSLFEQPLCPFYNPVLGL